MKEEKDARVGRVFIELRGTKPRIWRVVDVPLAITLKHFHLVIQAAIGWTNTQRYIFEVCRKRFFGLNAGSLQIIDEARAQELRLDMLVAQGIKHFIYKYDLEDKWHHNISIESVGRAVEGVKYPIFIQGEGRCPPEYLGDLKAFKAFLQIIANPHHPEFIETLEWHGDNFDPTDIDIYSIQKKMNDISSLLNQ